MRKGTSKSFKLVFHPSFYIVALGFFLTGNYLNFVVFLSLVLVHESGHCVMAKLFHLEIKSITIYPFGGITRLDILYNLEIEKELMVSMAGVMLQFVFYLFICFLFQLHIIREYVYSLYSLYNNSIIFFNLLPIYPLDGGRILYLLFCLFFPYKVSDYLIIFFSVFFIFVILGLHIYQNNYSNFMVYFLLGYYLFLFFQKRKVRYYRFLLERYLYSFSFSRIKIIHHYQMMYRNRKHYLFRDGNIYPEQKYITELFSNRKGRM